MAFSSLRFCLNVTNKLHHLNSQINIFLPLVTAVSNIKIYTLQTDYQTAVELSNSFLQGLFSKKTILDNFKYIRLLLFL